MEKKQEKTKEAFANAWRKATDFGKKAAEGTKDFVEQTKKSIHDQQAKKYVPITAKEFKEKGFQIPTIIGIEEESANREYIEDPNAIGWIERHKDVEVLHMYASFVKKSGLTFVPVPQRDNVYCADNFDDKKYINTNQVFGKATEEKLAELNHIAFCLGAKTCSIEIVEADEEAETRSIQINVKTQGNVSATSKNKNGKSQSGKTVSHFEGHEEPRCPKLKWFAHDDNIKGLIEMRFKKAIKSTVLELKGASSVTMSKAMACAVDDVLKIKGKISAEHQVLKEISNTLVYDVEF